jgi:NNP family nitrate/nitrite transporter-like MFS transporter
MSNISPFFPKRMQGLALGLNAGVGNLGVSIAQIRAVRDDVRASARRAARRLLPAALSASRCGSRTRACPSPSSRRSRSSRSADEQPADPQGRPRSLALAKAAWAETTGIIGSVLGIAILLGVELPIPDLAKMLLAMTITIVVTLALMRYVAPAAVRENLKGQFAIFSKKHNWTMTWLYMMTFGSFIGFSAAFPNLIQVVFGTLPDGTAIPAAPNPLTYAWLGLVGSVARPIGG